MSDQLQSLQPSGRLSGAARKRRLTRAPIDELIAVMARLRGPGGCPWDAEQTHASLVPYVIEEAHELAEAIETHDDAHMQEELGDVLLQVVFHADIARTDGRFDIDDVARGLSEKLRRRHPHVFADTAVAGIDEVVDNWDAIKRAEKPDRESAMDGIPPSLPALARAAKVLRRGERAGLLPADDGSAAHARDDTEEALGQSLLGMVRGATASGLDAERALRGAIRELEAELRDREAARSPDSGLAPL